MASKDPSIWLAAQAIQDAIQAVDGTGDWNFDLSGSGTVTFEERLTSRDLRVIIGPVSIVSGTDDTIRKNSLSVQYYVFAQTGTVASSNYPTRFEAVCRLGHDIARACSTAALQAALEAIETGRGDDILRTRADEFSGGGLPDGQGLGELAMIITIEFKKRVQGANGGF